MRYECVHCNERFDAEDTPRCPKCMRKHGLRKLEAASPGTSKPRAASLPRALGFGALLLLAAAGTAYVTLFSGGAGQTVLGPRVDPESTRRLKLAGAAADDVAHLYAWTPAMADYAKQLTASEDPVALAQAVTDAFAKQAAAQAFVPWPRADVRDGEGPLVAPATFDRIQKQGGRAHLYPLEVAVAAVSLLRSRDVEAQLVEVFAYPGERTALDPSGRIGYYALAVRPSKDAAPVLFDPYGGRKVAPKAEDFQLLDDADAVGAARALRAMHTLSSDPAAALADADAAVKLAPRSPTVRSVRGAVLLASGGTVEGERELEAAAQLRSDAPRRNNTAMLALAKGDAERAAKETALALAEAPDYAAGHLTLASVHMSRGEADLARAELEQAERIDPTLPSLSIAWAEWYVARGDIPTAIARAEAAVRARPKSPETRLVLARIYRIASRFDDMRVQAHAIYDAMPPSTKERTRTLLLNVLGPTALEEPTSDPSGSTTGDAPSPTPSAAAPTDLQLGTGEPKLRLGTGSSKLKLNLGN